MKSAVKILMCTIISTMIFLSGCTQKSQDTIIQFASWGSKSEIDILKPILNDFEKSNPDIKIDFRKYTCFLHPTQHLTLYS